MKIINYLKKLIINLEKIEWDYKFMYSFGCKADMSKKINIYFVNSFGSSYEIKEYMKTVYDCVQLFDSNNFPIILLSNLNQGGVISNAQLLLELLSPKTTFNIYKVFRNNGIYKDKKTIESEILSEFSDFENCQRLTYEKFENITKKID